MNETICDQCGHSGCGTIGEYCAECIDIGPCDECGTHTFGYLCEACNRRNAEHIARQCARMGARGLFRLINDTVDQIPF